MTRSVMEKELCTKHVKVFEEKTMRAKHGRGDQAFKAITPAEAA